MTILQIILVTCAYAILLVAVVYFTRPTSRRIVGALVGGAAVGLFGMGAIVLGNWSGLWQGPVSWTPALLLAAACRSCKNVYGCSVRRTLPKSRFRKESVCMMLLAGLVVLWSLNTICCFSPQKMNVVISPSPSTAADDLVYFADSAGWIHALRSNGDPIWRYSLADGLAAQNQFGFGDLRIDRLIARSHKQLYGLARVESGSKAGSMILFALEGDHLHWFKEVAQPEPNGSPVVVGDNIVYLAGTDGILYAFARDDGHSIWQSEISKGRIGAPSLGADGIVYLTGARHNLHAIGPDGKQLWTAQTNLQ